MSVPPSSANASFAYSSPGSLAIAAEVEKFESVQKSINSIFELLDLDPHVSQSIRAHFENVRECVVNSQEWTLPRAVSVLRVGLLGSPRKSALVQSYIPNQYVQDNFPKGGRFKKEILVNNTPYLLLLRDEDGDPDLQFSLWTDALILVATSFESTDTCFKHITRLANYRSLNDVTIVLVSVDEDSSSTSPSKLEYIEKFKKIPHSVYVHCNVSSGMNVELLFSEVCTLIVNKGTVMGPPSTTRVPLSTRSQRSERSTTNFTTSPVSTPTSSRKFSGRAKGSLLNSATQGSGRTVPTKEGYLFKKSNKSKLMTKRGKKKYVIISEGKLGYFDHKNQYIDDPNSGKVMDLKYVTVKLAGKHDLNVKTVTESLNTMGLKQQSPKVPSEDVYSFQVVSGLNYKKLEFETTLKTERDQWVELIQGEIVKSLQANFSDRVSSRRDEGASEEEVSAVKRANHVCADCRAVLSKGGGYWASLNLCVVVCIACSGVHRNLGVHISKVRSMELDEMSNHVIAPLKSIESNTEANKIYEATVPPSLKPNSNCSQEERSTYIRRKYENLEFLPKEPTHVTQDMVTKSIKEKDFWSFLLFVNAVRKEGTSKAFWSDGTMLDVATDINFSAAAQIIAWVGSGVM